MLDKPETISFSSLLKCFTLTLLQLSFICSSTLIYSNKKVIYQGKISEGMDRSCSFNLKMYITLLKLKIYVTLVI